MTAPRPVAIVFPSGELARFTRFENSLHALHKPPGNFAILRGEGSDISANMNGAIRQAIEHVDPGWFWILADDHDFAPDTLLRLMAHGLDVVSPLVMARKPEFLPILYRRDRDPESGLFQQFFAESLPAGGLVVSGQGGAPELYPSVAGMLVSRRAMDAVGDPWFESGRMVEGYLNEDFWFVEKLHRAGFTPAVDLDVHMGHCTTVSVWPKRGPGRWDIDLRFGAWTP
jgi:hypothetical protein